jgi:hypothetical protein
MMQRNHQEGLLMKNTSSTRFFSAVLPALLYRPASQHRPLFKLRHPAYRCESLLIQTM